MSTESISLHYKDGGSDKVYNAQIDETGDKLFVVNFQYGRRGSTLQTGTKTTNPIPFQQAKKIYDKLVSEKKSKGYTEAEDGTPFVGTDKAGQVSGLVPQLLNPIDETRANELMEDDDWFMQEKVDGHHQMIKVDIQGIQFSNRKGLIVPGSDKIINSVANILCNSAILDGEAIGDKFVIFDLLGLDGKNMYSLGAYTRYKELLNLSIVMDASPALSIVRSEFKTANKRALFNKIKAERGEGVVFKHIDAEYVPGRPNSGGNMLKFKFKASATCFVITQNVGKRSVQIGVNDPKHPQGWVEIGNVTIPSNQAIPDGFIEVEYLYAFDGGRLFQPVYKGPRNDKTEADLYNSLKFKQGSEEEES